MAVISYDPEGDSRTTYDHLILKAATVLHFDMMFSWFTRTFAQFFWHHGHEQWIKTPVDPLSRSLNAYRNVQVREVFVIEIDPAVRNAAKRQAWLS